MSHYLKMECTALDDVKVPILKKAVKAINSEFSLVKKSSSNNSMTLQIYNGGYQTRVELELNRHEDNKTSLTIKGEFYRTGFDIESFRNELCKNYSLAFVDQMRKDSKWSVVEKQEEEEDIVLTFAV